MNLNYVAIVKQDLNKLFAGSFIKSVEETIGLSPIVVIPKKNGKLKICVNFKKFNTITNKDLYINRKPFFLTKTFLTRCDLKLDFFKNLN